MGNNISASGTVHLRAILNAALDSDNGIRLVGITHARAIHLRGLLHAIRSVDRKKSRQMYPDPMHPNYGRSAYDALLTEITPCDEDTVSLRIVRSAAAVSDIQVVDDKTGKAINLDEYKE